MGKLTLEDSYKWLNQKNVAFGILNTTDDFDNELACAVAKNIMEFWIEEILDQCDLNNGVEIVKISKTLEELLSWSIDNKFDYIIVSKVGTTFKNKGLNFVKQLQNYFHNNDIKCVGDKEVFILNLNWWQDQQKPNIDHTLKMKPWDDEILLSKNFVLDNHSMHVINKHIQTNTHFIANTEDAHKISKQAGNFDALVCTAGGFTPIIRAWGTDLQPNSKVVVIDNSHLALKFSRDTVDGFIDKRIDIYNFEETLRKMMLDYMPDDPRHVIYDRDLFQSQDKIEPMQKVYTEFANNGLAEYIRLTLPKLSFRWVLEDLFNVHDVCYRIISQTKDNERVLLNFSNVLSYYNTSLFYNFKTKRFLYKELLTKLHEHDPKKYWIQKQSKVLSLQQIINSSKTHEARINSVIEW